MKELLKQYASYNVWANERLCSLVVTMPEELAHQTVVSSFPTIHKTLLHVWDAESVWWQRLKLSENVVWQSTIKEYSIEEVIMGLQQQDKLFVEWITDATVAALEHVFAYQNSKKEQFKQPVFQMLLHLFNHGTYHRGQLVTMLRELGVEKIPPTDFIVFSRRK
jgi:uncharacterized damage-inducible protein DinB